MSREMKDSGVEWIGEIPEDWDIQRGKFIFQKLSRSVQDNDEVITCFRDGEVTLRKNRREEGFTFSDKEIGYQGIEPGDLVVHGMDGFAGSIGISDSRGKATPVLNVLDTKYSKLYYMYYLRSMAYGDVFTAIATGIRVRSCNLNWNKLGELSYPVPSANEQKDIANYIKTKCTAIDTAIEKTKKSIEKLEEYKKAVITKAVTKGIDPNAKMKDSGVEWIGEIPEDWEITRNKFYVIISHGMDPKTEGDIPVYGSGAESFKSCGEYKEGPAVLLGRKGATLHIPHYITGKYWNVDTAFDVKTKSEDMGLKYFYFLSMCFNYNYYIAKTTLPSMTQFDYCNMRIPLPSRKEQDIIVSYIEDKCVAIDTAIEKKKKAIEKWEKYKKSLIYYAVTGKIDCRNEVIE